MSKSGLFAHFGSKEELQLATIETAGEVFAEQVLEPAADAATGLERLQQLTDGFLRHVEGGVFPGGCFFASVAAEMDTHPGPVRDLAVQVANDWLAQLEAAVRDAQAEGAIDPSEDPAQLAFELNAYLLLANAQFVISRESTPFDRARRALERRLAAQLRPPERSGTTPAASAAGPVPARQCPAPWGKMTSPVMNTTQTAYATAHRRRNGCRSVHAATRFAPGVA